MIPLSHYLIISAALFVIGAAIVITKRNAIMVLMGIELILNAANINLVAFDKFGAGNSGKMFSLFVIVIAASEAAVALAIIIRAVRTFNTTNLDKMNELKKK